MERAMTQREWRLESPATVSVRLTGGASTHATWLLEDGPGGTAITVGADPQCDWTIKAASVPAHALSILLLQGTVYVRSGPQGGVALNGQALAEGWQTVPSSARVDVGLARLELDMGSSAALAEGPRSWVVHNVETPPDAELVHTPSILVDDSVSSPEPARGRSYVENDAEVSGLRPSRNLRPEPMLPPPRRAPGTRTSWFDRPSRSSLPDAPSLIGGTQPGLGKHWLYLGGSVLLGSVYVIWLSLLDR